MENILLYGMRGCGKTSIGKKVAHQLGYVFLDLDKEIVKESGISVSEFIEKNGRDAFRDQEHFVLKNVLEIEGKKVISLGGGTITFERNQNLILKNNFKLIYIDTHIEKIVQRITHDQTGNSNRPSQTGKSLADETREIYEKRKDIYESFYDIKIENNGDINETIHQIIEKINFGGICVPIIDFEENKLEKINKSREIKFVELRLDYLLNSRKEYVKKFKHKQIILTLRSKNEGGKFEGTDEEYREIIDKLKNIEEINYIDIELQKFEFPLIRGTVFERSEKTGGLHTATNSQLILSFHNFQETPSLEKLKGIVKSMSKHNPDVYKIAVMPNTESDVKIIYELTDYFKENYPDKDFIFISMGELGKQTRIDIPKMGGLLTFATLENQASAPGQIDYQTIF